MSTGRRGNFDNERRLAGESIRYHLGRILRGGGNGLFFRGCLGTFSFDKENIRGRRRCFFVPRDRVRMSIVRRRVHAVKELIDADSTAFITTYTMLQVRLQVTKAIQTRSSLNQS
ncbi:hypothetical protein ANTQUA_LOCUS8445 [Anthophora quadrimaculata]